MALVLSVPHTVMAEDGVRIAVPQDGGPVATVKYKCLWTDCFALANDLLGTSVAIGTTITRVAPYRFPPSPNMTCISIDDISPLGPGFPWFGLLVRKEALLTATFGIRPYPIDGPSAYRSISIGVGGEAMTMPGSVFRFPSGTPTNTAVSKTIAQIDISVKAYQLPYLPLAEMAGLVGMVNDATYSVGDYLFPVDSLLFSGGSSDIKMDSLGNITNEIEYKMTYRSVPWNQVMSPDRSGAYQGFQTITDGGGATLYQRGDFTVLP